MSLEINPEKISHEIVVFLEKEFKKRNKKNAILGISGGIDSAVCAYLCKQAGLGLYAINIPYKRQGIKDSKLIEKDLGLNKNQVITINIGKSVDEQIKELEKFTKLDLVDKGNIMARQRMIIQYSLARRLGGLVVGTENLSEYYLAYFTLYGDQACDISPIAGLLKTQVYQLAKFLEVPTKIITKAPSAGLWKNQSDEQELGFTYAQADPIIYLKMIRGCSDKKIIENGFSKRLVSRVSKRIKETDFKRQEEPKYYL